MEEKTVFLPFSKSLYGTASLLIAELRVNLEKVEITTNSKELIESEFGGLFFVLQKDKKRAEFHLSFFNEKVNIFIIFYSRDIYSKDSPIITSPEELSDYFPALVDFLKS